MKNCLAWTLIAVGLLYVLAAQFGQEQQPVELPAGAVPLQDNRAIPYDEPEKPVPTQQPSNPMPTFGGYPCDGDCSEDKSGYRWARENGITDPDACTGNSGAFIEGCRVYARQHPTETHGD